MKAEGSVPESEPEFVMTSEGRVAYVEAGPSEAEAPGACPLVLLHGLTGHRDDFLPVLASLARSRRVVVPDLRGHGDSVCEPGTSGWSLDQLVKDLSAFLISMGLDRIDLLGHSMGGFVAQRFVLAHPQGVRSLSLLCTGPEVPALLPRTGFEKAAAIAEAQGIDGLQVILEKVGRIDASPSISGWGERYWIHHRRRFRAMSAESYAGVGSAFFASESLVPRLREISQPTLVMVGEFDTDWLPGAELLSQNLSAAKVIFLSNAEHHPHQENTLEFLHTLEAHLDRAGQVVQGSQP